jgi:N-acyl-D-aspartate/D-glutamate deacylase
VADLVVVGALIVDGTGAPGRAGTVVVSGDRIEAILDPENPEPETARRIDARGLVLAPGFVDAHSHADATPFSEPAMDSMLRQGVTTLVVGNCGTSAFPPSDLDEVAALVGVGAAELGDPWRTFEEYLERVQACEPALNVAALVGHGSLRLATMPDQRRPPRTDEAAAMARLLEDALEQGALGLSTGLIYAPGLHASTQEIAELSGALARRGGVYASHVRGEGRTVFDAVTECIEIGRRAGVPSHVSHLKVEGPAMWGRAPELLSLIDHARATGADVTADQYPYTAWETVLAAALPPWVTAAELPAVDGDPHARARLVAEIERGGPTAEPSGATLGWDRVVVGSHVPAPDLTGRTIADLALERGASAVETVLDLLLGDPNTGMVGHGMDEDDVRAIASRPDVFVGTDGVAVGPDGPLGAFAVHPRYYGTFPRVLARYVRKGRVLSLEDAVRKMTSLPARRFGLAGRGTIEPGAFADLVLFDAVRVEDRATYERPHAFARGIEAVVVNGRVAWDGSTGGRAGRALRRGER